MNKEIFEELTPEQNQIIQEARDLGYSGYFPTFPDSKTQAINTLKNAKKFIKETKKFIKEALNNKVEQKEKK